jgi:hypothetical protein
MPEKRVPSDVIKAIFHYLGSKQRFPADVPKIHEIFYRICQESEFSPLCSDFIFDTSRSFPYSATIRYALDRLQKANLLACINPGLDEFEVSEELGRTNPDSDIERLFNEKEKRLLRKASGIFGKQICA